jgi:hypothetical protein
VTVQIASADYYFYVPYPEGTNPFVALDPEHLSFEKAIPCATSAEDLSVPSPGGRTPIKREPNQAMALDVFENQT